MSRYQTYRRVHDAAAGPRLAEPVRLDAAALRLQRLATIDDLWRRMLAGLPNRRLAERLAGSVHEAAHEGTRVGHLRRYRELAGLVARNAMEAAVLNTEHVFRPSEPTRAFPDRPGTRARIEEMARRAAAGEELWTEDNELMIAD